MDYVTKPTSRAELRRLAKNSEFHLGFHYLVHCQY